MVRQPQSSNSLRMGVAFRLMGLAASLATPSLAGQSQSIQFDSLPVLLARSPDLSPKVLASSTLAVALESSDTTVVSIVEGRLRPKKVGWARVIARQAGDTQFDPAPEVEQLVWVVNRPRMLTTWGKSWRSPAGPIVVPDSVRRDVMQISSRFGTVAGIRPNGQVFVVSGHANFKGMEPVSMPNVAKVRVGYAGRSVVAIRKDGSIQDWGDHRGGYPAGAGPVVVDSLNHGIVDVHLVEDIFQGDYAIVHRADGTTFGLDIATRRVWELPSEVRSGVVATAFASNITDSLQTFAFLRADGSLITWNRRVGLTTLPDSLRTNIRSVSAGVNFLVVVDRNGRVMEHGFNGPRTAYAVMPTAKLSSQVVSVDVDGDFAVAQKQDGSVVTWGRGGWEIPAPDSLVGGSTEIYAAHQCGFVALGMLKPTLTFTTPAKTNWGDGNIEAGLVLQPGRVPVFGSTNPDVADFREGRILVKHVGTTTLSVTYPADSMWLGAGPISQTLTVAARRVIVEAKKEQKTYGEADPKFSFTCSQCGPLDTLTGQLGRASGESVGAYPIQQGSLRASPDHELVFVSEEFKISPRKISVQADSVAKLAGAADPALTYRADGLLAQDKLTGSLARDSGEEPGTYPIRMGSLVAGENYQIEYLGANLRISATSGLLARAKAPGKIHEVHAKVRRPFVDRSMSSQGAGGLAPQAGQIAGEAILDVLLPASGHVEVAIFDNAGIPVHSWAGEVSMAQWQQLAPTSDGRRRLAMVWDLKSRSGTSVSDGVYLCRIVVQTESGAKLEQVLRIGVR